MTLIRSQLEKFEKLLEQEMARVEAFCHALDRVQSSLPGSAASSPDSTPPPQTSPLPEIPTREPKQESKQESKRALLSVHPADYHSHDAYTITSTSLRDYLRSPLYYYHRYVLGDVPPSSSRTFTFGSAVHCLALEPEEFSLRFYVDPFRAGSTASRDLAERYEGLDRLTQTEYDNATLLARILGENPWGQANVYDHALSPLYEREFAVHTPDGLTLKCKPDCLTDSAIVDLKTFGRVQSEFADHAHRLGYHIQAAFYAGVLALSGDTTQRDFVFWVICKSAPYSVFQYVIPYDDLVSVWDRDVRPALRRLRTSLETNDWADSTGTSEEINLHV